MRYRGLLSCARFRYTGVLALVILFSFPFSHVASGTEKDGGKDDPAVAKVGDVTISEAELVAALDNYVPPGVYHAGVDPSKKDKYRKDALDELIDFTLLYKGGLKKGTKVPDEKIDEVVKANAKRYGSMEKLKEALRRDHLTMGSFRARIKKYQVVMSMLQDIAAESAYTDAALRDYYEKNKGKFRRPESMHLYQILIPVDPAAGEEEVKKKKEKADEVLGKIKAGEDFGETAYKYSEDDYRFKSGDIGFVHKGELIPQELEDAAFSLKQGEVSGVIRTVHGFHILKDVEKRPEETLDFESVKKKLKSSLEKARFTEKKKEMLTGLRAEFPVVIYLKFDDDSGSKEGAATEESGKAK